MKQAALICAFLAMFSAEAFAASPDALWQDYQKSPGYVSNQPTKQAPAPEPNITIEAQDGTASVPTTPEQAKAKAEAAQADSKTFKEQADSEAEPKPAELAPKEQGKNNLPVVSNKPVAAANKPKPKPKLNLVGKPPLPRQFMRTPQASDFTIVTSSAGYTVSLPNAFGTDPLANLPQAEGAMAVRTANDALMCAVTVLDAADSESYMATQALPAYENKQIYWQWQHGESLVWSCVLSTHNDYHGDKVLLEAQTEQAGKTYQMLFVMPGARLENLLPQAVYALNSFTIN